MPRGSPAYDCGNNTLLFCTGEMPMSRIDRRRFVQLSGAGAATAASGGLAAILATGRAPAYAQGASVHWLRWSDFVQIGRAHV